MLVRVRDTGAVMYLPQWEKTLPNTSFPNPIPVETLNEFGVDVVLDGPQATGGTVYQYSQQDGVEEVDGKWYTKHILGPVFTDTPATEDSPAKTAAENEAAYKAIKDAEQAKSVRQTRDQKLKDSDWTQVADAPVNKEDWAAYRQALRNLPNEEGFPWTVVMPKEPTEIWSS
jgi:hypothetical protein